MRRPRRNGAGRPSRTGGPGPWPPRPGPAWTWATSPGARTRGIPAGAAARWSPGPRRRSARPGRPSRRRLPWDPPASGSPAPGSLSSCAQSAAGRMHAASARYAGPVIVGHHGRVPGIYDEPEFYEAACAYRDVPAEVNALLRWSAKHHGPDSGLTRSVLELAAGPAEHARTLARRGLAATALDLNPAMCARARELAEAAGAPL